MNYFSPPCFRNRRMILISAPVAFLRRLGAFAENRSVLVQIDGVPDVPFSGHDSLAMSNEQVDTKVEFTLRLDTASFDSMALDHRNCCPERMLRRTAMAPDYAPFMPRPSAQPLTKVMRRPPVAVHGDNLINLRSGKTCQVLPERATCLATVVRIRS